MPVTHRSATTAPQPQFKFQRGHHFLLLLLDLGRLRLGDMPPSHSCLGGTPPVESVVPGGHAGPARTSGTCLLHPLTHVAYGLTPKWRHFQGIRVQPHVNQGLQHGLQCVQDTTTNNKVLTICCCVCCLLLLLLRFLPAAVAVRHKNSSR